MADETNAGGAEGAGAGASGAAGVADRLRESGQKIAGNASSLNLKVLDQAEANAQEAFAAMRRAAEAKDLSDVMRIHGDFLREQGSRSMAQAREIGELIVQFGRDAVEGMRGGKK